MVKRGVARKLFWREITQYKGPVFYIPHTGVRKPDRIETVITHTRFNADKVDIIDVNKFGSYREMIRITSRILNAKKEKSLRTISISPTIDDLLTAENWYVKRVQTTLHPDWENHYCWLGPVMRKDGIITVGEHIPKWLKDNYNQNEYILLPPNHAFTRLYVRLLDIQHHTLSETLVAMQTDRLRMEDTILREAFRGHLSRRGIV
ncbi:hypothetical protein E2C01_003579 [Portunus trituberculatus]|uniref:Uncharacterized protein n=1 Tax=Portunus trituberculatus TaxID=210409 RepID=A0A5B7CP22_PORTR|nr:hypothetical protein [Portunus trituberculatus]